MNVLWTDGSSSMKTGQMGWAYVGHVGGEYVKWAGYGPGTNQAAELTAAFMAIDSVPEGSQIRIVTDSEYVIHSVTKWRRGWEGNGMVNYEGNPISNRALIEALWEVCDARDVTFDHVKGHTGDAGNEMADALAMVARRVAEGLLDDKTLRDACKSE